MWKWSGPEKSTLLAFSRIDRGRPWYTWEQFVPLLRFKPSGCQIQVRSINHLSQFAWCLLLSPFHISYRWWPHQGRINGLCLCNVSCLHCASVNMKGQDVMRTVCNMFAEYWNALVLEPCQHICASSVITWCLNLLIQEEDSMWINVWMHSITWYGSTTL
jgi:hypothetical protein